MNPEYGCIVMTLRKDREDLVVHTPLGPVYIEIQPATMHRSRVIVRAPKAVEIGRHKREETSHDRYAV